MVPGIGRNLLSVMTAVKKDPVATFDFKNPRLEGIDVTVPLRSESGGVYSFVLDLSTGGFDAKNLPLKRSHQCPGVAPGTGSFPFTNP